MIFQCLVNKKKKSFETKLILGANKILFKIADEIWFLKRLSEL